MTLTAFIVSWLALVIGFVAGYLHRYKVDEPKHYERMVLENILVKTDNRNLRSRLQGLHEERGMPRDPADWWKEKE